jgi:hypothetical protein
MADDSLPKQQEQRVRGRPFAKGRSGNPAGRPRGTRNRATLIGENLLSGEVEALTRKVVKKALAGDGVALRLCLERLIPRVRERAVRIALPPVKDAADIAPMMAAVADALARGEITPGEAGELGRLVEAFVRALEAGEFERRLRALEAAVASGP